MYKKAPARLEVKIKSQRFESYLTPIGSPTLVRVSPKRMMKTGAVVKSIPASSTPEVVQGFPCQDSLVPSMFFTCFQYSLIYSTIFFLNSGFLTTTNSQGCRLKPDGA